VHSFISAVQAVRQALAGEEVFSPSSEHPAYTKKLEHITVHTAPRDSVTGPAHACGELIREWSAR
jgi:hypothetical protein